MKKTRNLVRKCADGLGRLSDLGVGISSLALLVMCAMIVLEILVRKIFNSSIYVAIE